jgi:hypothetical protein
LKSKIFTLIALFFSIAILAQKNQETDKEIDSIIEELMFSDSEDLLQYIQQLNKYQVLYTSVGFTDKTYFLGRDLGLGQYSLTTQVFYEHSNGIFVGISGAFYSELDPKWDLTTLTGGYGDYFGKHKNFSYELSYNRYIFSDTGSSDFENSFDVSISAETKDNSFGIAADAAYFFGGKQGFQNSFDVYGEIPLFKLKHNSKITFNPLLTFQFGSENIDTSRIDDLGITIPIIDRIVTSFEKYDLRNIQLQLPVTLDIDNFQVEAGYNFNFPNALEFERNLDNSSFFNLRLSYMFDLK